MDEEDIEMVSSGSLSEYDGSLEEGIEITEEERGFAILRMMSEQHDIDLVLDEENIGNDDSNDGLELLENTNQPTSTVAEESQDHQSTEESSNQQSEETNKEPPHSDRANLSIDDDDGQTCSICLETWTISGDHRLASLKCGHLFGNSCIVRWLKQSAIQNRACPSCKSRANLRDVRFIFARKVVTADNTQEEQLKQELEVCKTKNSQLKAELLTMTTNQRMYAVKINELQKEISSLRQQSDQMACQRRRMTNWRYTMHCNTEICKNSSCRVLAFNNRNRCIYVSLMSTNNLFPGFAMRKINCDNWSLNKLLYLHPKAIRDAAYSPCNDLLMTVGLDKYVKLVQGANDLIVTTIQSQMPLWSCCWDATNTNRLWVGGVGGIVCEYDIRQSKTAMSRITATDVSPVASLASVSGGFIACRLNTITSYRKIDDSIHSVQLPIDGIFTCVRSEPTSNDLLISCRSSSNHPRSRHIYCKSDLESFEFNPHSTFEGSLTLPLMSKSVLYSIEDQHYVSAYNGDESAVCTWSVSSGNRMHSLGASDYVVDIVPLTDNGGNIQHLATLSQSRIRIHQVMSSGD